MQLYGAIHGPPKIQTTNTLPYGSTADGEKNVNDVVFVGGIPFHRLFGFFIANFSVII